MTYDEYVRWQLYADEYPFGWAEDQRAALIVAACASFGGNKINTTELFPSLKHMAEKRRQNHLNSLRGSIMLNHMMKSVGGKHLDF